MTENHTCLVRYIKPYVTQETSAEYLLNKINMYPMLIPQKKLVKKNKLLAVFPVRITRLLVCQSKENFFLHIMT